MWALKNKKTGEFKLEFNQHVPILFAREDDAEDSNNFGVKMWGESDYEVVKVKVVKI